MRNNLIASELKQEDNCKNQRDFYSSLAYLAMMPFHHLLSAKEIYSFIFDQSPEADISEKKNITRDKIPSVELQQLIQEAASRQNPDNADPIMLDDSISADFFETGDAGERFKTNWTVIFRGSSLQGSAEIYRAEMFLFKRLICERKEKLKDSFILTDKEFSTYLDYEMFGQLTSDEPEILLLNSLTSLYQISATSLDDIKTDGKTARDDKFQSDESNEQSDFDSADKDSKKMLDSHTKSVANTSILTERINSWKKIPIASDQKSELVSKNSLSDNLPDKIYDVANLLNRNTDSSHHISKELSDESSKITLYKLNLGSYWRKWQQAAQAAEFDFDMLETLEDVRAIRFYELTKFLRLELFDETTLSLPNELKIEYRRFAKLMPLPTLQTKDEIERQIAELIKPLKNAGYVKSFSNEDNLEDKTNNFLLFRFGE